MQNKKWGCVFSMLLIFSGMAGPAGCKDDESQSTASDADADSDADTDTDVDGDSDTDTDSDSDSATDLPITGDTDVDLGTDVSIIFLHHSTGSNVWGGGVPEWFTQYNADNGTNYSISELAFPDGENYPWANYPYDYWYLWVENGGPDPVEAQPTLEMLTTEYDVIVFKHCFPVSSIVEDNGTPDISSEEKTIANYQLQYAALKEKLHSFSDTRFVVWTGAANVAGATNEADAARARTFFDWVKTEWDESGDNIYIWDFFELETEGGIYLLEEYAAGATDSHPNESFCQYAAPLFSNRVVNVITGRGDATGILGE